MTKAKQHAIRAYILMRNHHQRMLDEAINCNDTVAIHYETRILSQLKANIKARI